MDKVALVPGSGGALGPASRRAFSDAGYAVVSTDAPGVAGGDQHVPIELQRFASDAQSRFLACKALRKLIDGRPLAALVNNAAVQRVAPVEELGDEAWKATLEVNLLAPFHLVRELLPELRAARGSVVNIASIHATRTKPGFVAYATSKAALAGMTRAMAVELSGAVRLNSISPAAIDTPMLAAGFEGKPQALAALAGFHPVGRIGRPEEVAALALFLASDAAGFISGADFALDGGIGPVLPDPA